jgi:hypothetical protein
MDLVETGKPLAVGGRMAMVSVMRWILLVALLGCGGKQVSSTQAALISAAAAAATTAIDPDYASREEADAAEDGMRSQKVSRTVPAEVFDRLDQEPSPP